MARLDGCHVAPFDGCHVALLDGCLVEPFYGCHVHHWMDATWHRWMATTCTLGWLTRGTIRWLSHAPLDRQHVAQLYGRHLHPWMAPHGLLDGRHVHPWMATTWQRWIMHLWMVATWNPSMASTWHLLDGHHMALFDGLQVTSSDGTTWLGDNEWLTIGSWCGSIIPRIVIDLTRSKHIFFRSYLSIFFFSFPFHPWVSNRWTSHVECLNSTPHHQLFYASWANI